MATEWEQPVGSAIASMFASVDGIQKAVALDADNLTKLPAAIVLAPALELLERTGSHELWQADYPAYLIAQPLQDEAKTAAALVLLVGRVRIAWLGSDTIGIKLGLAYVQDSWITGATPELFSLGEDDEELPAYRFSIRTLIREAVTRKAGPTA